jgi:hypothetical protein
MKELRFDQNISDILVVDNDTNNSKYFSKFILLMNFERKSLIWPK